jgi:hypothetical protein
MASDKELINTYTIQYQELLDLLKQLDKEHPEDVHGYNIIVDYARKVSQRAKNVGTTSLDPLPQEK